MEMMDEALEEANLILSSIELITIKTLCFLAITFFCFFVFFMQMQPKWVASPIKRHNW